MKLVKSWRMKEKRKTTPDGGIKIRFRRKRLLAALAMVCLLSVIVGLPGCGASGSSTGSRSTEGAENSISGSGSSIGSTGGTGNISGNGNTGSSLADSQDKTAVPAGAEKGLEEMEWWKKTNAYEIYVNSFQDSDDDGYGDLNGIRSRLDHLKDLGVGAVWLTPIYASPMVDNGYDVADFYEINPRYGTMEDMEKLIQEADEKGIKIVMDLVFNHTSDQCKWFVESSKSKDNPYSDWYIWRDPREDGSAPNNWRSIFGGSAWTWCEARGQYYLHTFASAQPDLNWENPDVRQALCDVANFWIDKGVGGFRMDAIPYIKKPDDFSDGPADDAEGMASIHTMTANTEGILDYLQEFKEKVTDGKDVFTVAEANGVSADQLFRWVGEKGVFDMLFEFSHINIEFGESEFWCRAGDWSLTDLKKTLTDSQKATADNGWYPIFFENHDQPRSIDHFFPEDADPVLAGKAMGTILLTLRGTPFIYQGEELGYKNVAWPSIDDYNDLNTRSQYTIALEEGCSKEEALDLAHRYSRDNARTPMQWDGSKNAGFTGGTPWLPVHDDYAGMNADGENKDPESVLSKYKELAALRRDNPVLINGSYEEKLHDSEQIYAYIRENEDDRILVMVNFSGETVDYETEEAGIHDKETAELLTGNYPDKGQTIGTLRPYEAVVIRCR